MVTKHGRKLKYGDVGDDDDDDYDDDNDDDNNNLLHFTSYLRKIFCVGLPLYRSSIVLSHIMYYGVQESLKYKKSNSLTFN